MNDCVFFSANFPTAVLQILKFKTSSCIIFADVQIVHESGDYHKV